MQLFGMLTAALVAWFSLAAGQAAQAAERRLALVVGKSAYADKPLATAANDAGLIAQTLQAAGFDVTGARDLEEEALKRAFRDFLDKAAGAGPGTVAFIYYAGYGLQLEGENYLIPIDARVARDADIPLRALRVSDSEAARRLGRQAQRRRARRGSPQSVPNVRTAARRRPRALRTGREGFARLQRRAGHGRAR